MVLDCCCNHIQGTFHLTDDALTLPYVRSFYNPFSCLECLELGERLTSVSALFLPPTLPAEQAGTSSLFGQAAPGQHSLLGRRDAAASCCCLF